MQWKLYLVRCTFENTAELDPRYVIARSEEEAVGCFYRLYAHFEEVIEMPCEIVVEERKVFGIPLEEA